MRCRRLVIGLCGGLGLLWSLACATVPRSGLPLVEAGGVRFTVSFPQATTVAVAGSFNQWSAVAHPLKPAGADGVWTTVVPLPAGEHPFMYVIDGTRWVRPPQAEEYVEDGFGQHNGVVIVREQRH